MGLLTKQIFSEQLYYIRPQVILKMKYFSTCYLLQQYFEICLFVFFLPIEKFLLSLFRRNIPEVIKPVSDRAWIQTQISLI